MSSSGWRPIPGLVVIALCLFFPKKVEAAPYAEVPALRLTLSWRAEGSAAESWILSGLPSAKDVVARDPALKKDLVNAVEALRAANANNPSEWNLKPGDPADFSRALKIRMRAYLDFNLIAPIRNGKDSEIFELKVGYHPSIAARKPIEIAIIVRGSRAVTRQPVVTTIGNLAAHHVGSLGELSEEEQRTRVFIGASDSPPAEVSRWATSGDHATAFRVAAAAFLSAKKHELPSNQPRSAEALKAGAKFGAEKEVISEIEDYVRGQFALPGDWNPIPSGDEEIKPVQSEYGSAPWKIRIALQAVEEVRFQVKGTRVDGTVEPVESHPRWAMKIVELESRVQNRERKNFDDLRGRLITTEEFPGLTEVITSDVEQENKIVAAGVDTGERSIIFTGYFQPRVTELAAGVGYSTDKKLNGSLSLASRNLLIDESLLKLSIIAGLEKRTGELSFGLPFPSRDPRRSFSLDLTAAYGKDDDLKLGAPESGGFDEECFGASVRGTFQISKENLSQNSPPATPDPAEQLPGRAYSAMLAASAGFSDTRLDAPPDLRSQVESGQVLFILLELKQSWKWKLRLRDETGLGQTSLDWNLKAKKGFEAGPGDFDFFTANTTITGNIWFGDKTSRDFMLRVIAGGAIVTGNDPIFEEFRLGGDSIVRGMEEGERIARGAFFDTVQAGVALERLWSGGSKAMGVDLKKIYLNLFFDHAVITRRGSRDQQGAPSILKAIGTSLEMEIPSETVQGSLEFGYAWSPDSIHEHGRVFTSVHLNF